MTGSPRENATRAVTLFLCGDVMTGRGIDQILPHPSAPQLFEPYVHSALEYVELAERANGPIPRRVPSDYVWGDALAELARVRPDARIVNLETAVTVSEDAVPGKGIHYRMNPANAACLGAAALDCCVLANNHVLDWGRAGLAETLATLHAAGLRSAGAGAEANEAAAPAVIELPGKRRVLVFAAATEDSGVPPRWAATGERSGVNLLCDLSPRSVDAVARQVRAHKRDGDLAVMSLHWGGNWDYAVSGAQRAFARGLVESAGIDVVHGHSSHHVKGIEVYDHKPILYGCGDFLTDYEGIGGHEAYRPELALMYFPTLDAASGRLLRFAATPTRMRRFRVERARSADARWLRDTLNREGAKLGTRAELRPDDTLSLIWS
ncbi:MAG: CapA family protein [Betaproteobacteria bacterium]|nr:CapA family protein [Betaproteobacteria bacterium]